MTRKLLRIVFISFLCLFGVYSVYAQFGMKMRTSDAEHIANFAKTGVPLEFRTIGEGTTMVHYAATGSDSLPTLLFIHGSPGSWDAFQTYLLDADLRAQFRIISIDRPGFGYSDFGNPHALTEQVQLCQKVIAASENGKPIHIIGHSIGGPVVLGLGQQYPDAIASLSILAGSISAEFEAKEKWRWPFISPPLAYLIPGALRVSNTEIWMFKNDLPALDTGYDKLTMPVYFIHGDKDPLVPVGNAYHGMKMLEGTDLGHIQIIPGANHFIPWEHYDLIKTHLLTLKKLR